MKNTKIKGENMKGIILSRLKAEKEKLKNSKNDTTTLTDKEVVAIEESVYSRCEEIIKEVFQDANNGWILCAERLPSKEECGYWGKLFQVTIPQADGNETVAMTFAYEIVKGKEVGRWKWNMRLSPWEVIAWKPMENPYTEKN